MLQFRDGPFIRPHPAFWRVVLGINLLYELALVFLLFQDLGSARTMMTYIDPALGVPLPEKSYAEDCTLTPRTIWVRIPSITTLFLILTPLCKNALDIFCVAHALGSLPTPLSYGSGVLISLTFSGWFGKAMILRDYWFCWVRSINCHQLSGY